MKNIGLSVREQWLVAVIVVLAVSLVLVIFWPQPDVHGNDYSFLNPSIARLNVDEFLRQQEQLNINYYPLRAQLTALPLPANATAGIYFEDLKTGAWVGVNEKEKFIPGSLLKVPALIAIMKKVESTDMTLDQRIEIVGDDVDFGFGPLAEKGSGYSLSLLELLNYSAAYSDNTADRALRRKLEYGRFTESMVASGLPYTTDIKDNIMPISAKDYASVLRSLYVSSYLKRSSSDLILSMLAHSVFGIGIVESVPSSVEVAHKIGTWKDGLYRHDCGIVYRPKNPYILCVMTKGMGTEVAYGYIADVSDTIYRYVSFSASYSISA